MSLPIYQVDAFTSERFKGNPAAVCLLREQRDVAWMQNVAAEMNLSETAFVRKSQVADFAVRYFTPAEEIPLAGHPTIATVWALVERGAIRLQGERTRITLELKAGVIPVDIFAKDGRGSPARSIGRSVGHPVGRSCL